MLARSFYSFESRGNVFALLIVVSLGLCDYTAASGLENELASNKISYKGSIQMDQFPWRAPPLILHRKLIIYDEVSV